MTAADLEDVPLERDLEFERGERRGEPTDLTVQAGLPRSIAPEREGAARRR